MKIQLKGNAILVMLTLMVTLTWSCRKKSVDYKQTIMTEIHIGALISMTGSGASTGETSGVALELARRDVEAQLNSIGFSVSIKMVIEDTKTDTAIALRKLKELFDQGIRLVIGPYSSAVVAHLKTFADQNGVLLVSPSSVATSLAIPNDNIFRFVTSDVIQAEAMSAMLVDDEIRIIVPIIRDDVWGNDLLQSVSMDFQKAGGESHEPVRYNPATNNFTALLEQLDANVALELGQHNADEVAVYMATFGEGTAILKAAGNYSNLSKVLWYGSSAFAQNGSATLDPDAGSFASGHGLPCPVYGLDESARFKWKPVKDQISLTIGRSPDVYALTAYDALWVSATTYATTGHSPGIEDLKQVFLTIAGDFFGVTGNTTLNRNGDRAHGNYDFWAIEVASSVYNWRRVAVYNSATGKLTRF